MAPKGCWADIAAHSFFSGWHWASNIQLGLDNGDSVEGTVSTEPFWAAIGNPRNCEFRERICERKQEQPFAFAGRETLLPGKVQASDFTDLKSIEPDPSDVLYA